MGEREDSPIAFAATLLLHALRVAAGEALLSKVAWEMLLRGSSAIGEASVVTVGSLVSAGHYRA